MDKRRRRAEMASKIDEMLVSTVNPIIGGSPRDLIFYYVFYTKSRKYTLWVKTMQFTLRILNYVFYTLRTRVLFPGQLEQRILH